MKKLLLSVVLSLFGIINVLNAQSSYDLNFVVTQNERVNSGALKVKIQVRKTPGFADFGSGNLSIGFVYNSAALSISNISNTINPNNYTELFNSSYDLVAAKHGQNVGAFSEIAFGFEHDVTDPFFSPQIISDAWVDVMEFEFEIIDHTQKLEFNNLGFGNNPLAQQWANTNYNSSSSLWEQVDQAFGTGYDIITYKDGIWTGGNGTNGAPNATDAAKELIIDPTTTDTLVTLIGDVEVDYFEIPTGFSLIMAPNATMRPFNQNSASYTHTATNEFILQADNTGYSQYIGPSIEGSIQQYVGTNEGWRNVALPVQSVTSLDLGGAQAIVDPAFTSFHSTPGTRDLCGNFGNRIPTVNVLQFEGGASIAEPHEWHSPASLSALGAAQGYSVFVGGENFTTSGVIEAQGSFNDPNNVGNFQYIHAAPHANDLNGASQATYTGVGCPNPENAADRKANWDGWALVANPFPCGLSIKEFCDDNSNIPYDNIRIWSKDKAYAIVGSGGIDYQYVAPGENANIPPMQAFWIKWNVAGTGQSLLFNDNQRVFSTEAFFKTAPEEVEVIAINLLDSAANNAILSFNDFATNGFDATFDSYAFGQPSESAPQLSFHNTYQDSKTVAPLFRNVVKLPFEAESYPLRFWSRTEGAFSFSLNNDKIPSSWKVYLEDTKLAPGVFKLLNNQSHDFDYSYADSPTRFILHFSQTSLRNKAFEKSENVFFNHDADHVFVKFSNVDSDYAKVQISNSVGQILFSNSGVETDSDFVWAIPSRAPQVYIISVIVDGEAESFKMVK